MIPSRPDVPLGASVKTKPPAVRASRLPSGLPDLWDVAFKTWAIAEADLRKLRHDPFEVFTRIMQPVLWLGVFGTVFAKMRALPPDVTANVTYLDFMAPGVIAQSALFIAIFSGLTVIWERDLGMLLKVLATPTTYGSIVSGKALAAGLRGLLQSVLVFLLAIAMGVQLSFAPWRLGLAILVLVFATASFATLSMILATLVRGRERMMGIGQLITMPLFFASNALYPISLMPLWLRALSHINPLSYEIDALRGLLVTSDFHQLGLDIALLSVWLAVALAVAARLFRRIAE